MLYLTFNTVYTIGSLVLGRSLRNVGVKKNTSIYSFFSYLYLIYALQITNVGTLHILYTVNTFKQPANSESAFKNNKGVPSA